MWTNFYSFWQLYSKMSKNASAKLNLTLQKLCLRETISQKKVFSIRCVKCNYYSIIWHNPNSIHINYWCFQCKFQFEIFLIILDKWQLTNTCFCKICVQSFRNTLNGEPSLLMEKTSEQQYYVLFITLVSVVWILRNSKWIHPQSPLYHRQDFHYVINSPCKCTIFLSMYQCVLFPRLHIHSKFGVVKLIARLFTSSLSWFGQVTITLAMRLQKNCSTVSSERKYNPSQLKKI